MKRKFKKSTSNWKVEFSASEIKKLKKRLSRKATKKEEMALVLRTKHKTMPKPHTPTECRSPANTLDWTGLRWKSSFPSPGEDTDRRAAKKKRWKKFKKKDGSPEHGSMPRISLMDESNEKADKKATKNKSQDTDNELL